MLTDLVWDAACNASALRDMDEITRQDELESKKAWMLVQAALDAGENPSLCVSLSDSSESLGGSCAQTNAIIIASSNGDLATLKILLASPLADVNVVDSDDDTALLMAARNGHPSCIAALLDAGARTDARNADGSTPLMLAAESRILESCAILAPVSSWSWADRDKKGVTLRQMALGAQRDSNIFAFLHSNMESRLLLEAFPATHGASAGPRSL